MGEKGKGMLKEVRWRRDNIEWACLTGCWEGSAKQTWEVQGSAGGRGSIGECGTRHKQNNNCWRGKRKENKSS